MNTLRLFALLTVISFSIISCDTDSGSEVNTDPRTNYVPDLESIITATGKLPDNVDIDSLKTAVSTQLTKSLNQATTNALFDNVHTI